MDGVRLTQPTILQTAATLPSPAASGASSRFPSGVLLVVAQGGHRIACHHPDTGEGFPASLKAVAGFDSVVLADLLMTKPVLYEQLLDLTIGDCRFVGWPVPLPAVPAVRMTSFHVPASDETDERAKAKQLRALNVVFVMPAVAAPGHETRYESTLAGCRSAADQLAHSLQREEACGGFVSRHVFSTGDGDGNRAAGSAGAGGGGSNGAEDGSGAMASGLSTADIAGGGGVGSATDGSSGPGGFGAISAVNTGAAPSTDGEWSAATKPRAGSHLSTLLYDTLQALASDVPVTLPVGARSYVAINTPLQRAPPLCLSPAPGAMPPPPPLRPYKALWLLEDPAAIAASLPADGSPHLTRLVHAANPLRSLEQLGDETGIGMSVLLSLVEHLVAWRKARILLPLTLDSTLAIQPDAPLSPPADFTALFGLHAEPSYGALLTFFSAPQPYAAVISAAEAVGVPKRRLVQMTSHLLRCSVLAHLQTTIHCVSEPCAPPTAPPHPPLPGGVLDGLAEQGGGSEAIEAAPAARPVAGGPVTAEAVGEATSEEERNLARWRLFRRLRPMFYGQHSIEEMMWLERIDREAVTDLTDAWAEHLVCVVTIAEAS